VQTAFEIRLSFVRYRLSENEILNFSIADVFNVGLLKMSYSFGDVPLKIPECIWFDLSFFDFKPFECEGLKP
jgi:hypothetical protein